MSVMIGGVDMNQASSQVAVALAQRQALARSATASTTATTTTGTAASSGTAASTTSTDNTGISSDDFLTLLVTEMKNQDPTQPTDPNAYISQLVGVNSLQQLISINQDLSSVASSGTSTAATGGVTSASGVS